MEKIGCILREREIFKSLFITFFFLTEKILHLIEAYKVIWATYVYMLGTYIMNLCAYLSSCA